MLSFSDLFNYSFIFAFLKEPFYSPHWILVGSKDDSDMGRALAFGGKHFCGLLVATSFVVISITILTVFGISFISHLFLLTIKYHSVMPEPVSSNILSGLIFVSSAAISYEAADPTQVMYSFLHFTFNETLSLSLLRET